MKIFSFVAIMFVALVAYSTGAIAENVYRCGNSYSEKPCTDGVVVNADDGRSAAQQQQSRGLLQRDAATLKPSDKTNEQKKPPSKTTKKFATSKKDAVSESSETKDKPVEPKVVAPAPRTKAAHPKKNKEPEYFTARAIVQKPARGASASK